MYFYEKLYDYVYFHSGRCIANYLRTSGEYVIKVLPLEEEVSQKINHTLRVNTWLRL